MKTPGQNSVWLEKARKYCTYQERCHEEVRTKLLELGVRGSELENIMAILIEENFLNEERFAVAYAGGKFRQLGWGKIKILNGLKQRKISEYCIKKGMKEIDEDVYIAELKRQTEKKYASLKDKNKFTKKSKTLKFMISRGFESEKVLEWLNVKS